MLIRSFLENFLATHNTDRVQFLVSYVPNTNPEVWSAKVGHFHGFGQNVIYLEAHGEIPVQAYKNLLEMSASMAAQTESHDTESYETETEA